MPDSKTQWCFQNGSNMEAPTFYKSMSQPGFKTELAVTWSA